MTERLRFLLVLAVLAVAGFAGMMALRARSSDEGSASKSAEAALARDYPMKSAKFSFSVQAKVNGVPGLADPFVIGGEGAFQRSGKTADFDLVARPRIPAVKEAGFPGFSDELGVRFAGNVLYVAQKGTFYELGRGAKLGLTGDDDAKQVKVDERLLTKNERLVGTEQVDGVETDHFAGDFDVAKFMEMYSAQTKAAGAEAISAIERLAVTEVVKKATFDLWVGKDDKVRKVVVDLGLVAPDRVQAQIPGFEGGDLKFEVAFTEIDKPQRIKAPRSAQSLGSGNSLFMQGLTAGLAQSSAAEEKPSAKAAAGGKADPSDYDAQTRTYLACVAKASKPEALQKCIADLR